MLNTNGTVTYTPNTDFSGDDSFTYTVEDPFGNEATGTVFVTILSPQAPPTSLWTATNTAVSVVLTDLAFDPDGDTLTATAVTQGTNGTVNLSGGTATYTPSTGFTGDDHFTYTVEDPDGNEATNTITVTVGPIDPVAIDGEAATDENTAVVVEVLDIAFQPAGGSLTVTAVSQGANGSVTINLDGTVTYTPDTNFTGTDTFTYTVTDATSTTGTGTITVQVGPAAPTEANGIVDQIAAIDQEIDNYNDGPLTTINSQVPPLVNAVADYVTGFSSLVFAINIDRNAPDKMYKEALQSNLDAYHQLTEKYNELTNMEALLLGTLQSSKTLLERLFARIKAEYAAGRVNNGYLLGQLLFGLLDVHLSLYNAYTDLRDAQQKAYEEAYDAWASLKYGFPLAPQAQNLPRPVAPPAQDLKDLIPKIP